MVDISRYWENWQEEVDSAAQYRAMSTREKNPKIAKIYQNLASVEEKHASFWERQLEKAGQRLKPRKPSWRSRFLIGITTIFGPKMILPTVASSEHEGRNNYDHQEETKATTMAQQERWHSKVLHQLVHTSHDGMRGAYLAKIEGRHRLLEGNTLRAAVLGVNDGLCSNLSLVMGVAGASIPAHSILLTGIAGMVAGASSMALGEWISVKSSKEMSEREIRIEANELDSDPEGEGEELQLIYESKGIEPAEAKKIASQMMSDKVVALDTLTREELGIDPNDPGGSPSAAAASSFVLFTLGAIVPVIPYFFWNSWPAIAVSIAISALALFVVGSIITIFTGKSVWISGGRQLLFGLLAACFTFGVGKLIGTVAFS
jgi:VIT1/CCC1 family predicted Fe2+/Mn2+ transporter